MKAIQSGHLCQACMTIVDQTDIQCGECESDRPHDGWVSVRDSTDMFLGRVIGGNYLIRKRIGAGSYGQVYQVQSLNIPRKFAAKILKVEASDSELGVRLQREISAVGVLRNPHMVPFYDVIDIGTEYIAIIMEQVEGITLEHLVRTQGPLDFARAINITKQISNGLFEAHQYGLIHRDLKPENLMVEVLPTSGDFVRILDFGIVKVEGSSGLTNGFIGTPLYCSPEGAVGSEVDHRADIYALGAILFFMLTGRPPFVERNAMAALHAHVTQVPPTLAEVMPDERYPELLQGLLDSLLAKDPDLRPDSLDIVIRRLAEIPHDTNNSGLYVSPSMAEDSVSWFAPNAEDTDASRVVDDWSMGEAELEGITRLRTIRFMPGLQRVVVNDSQSQIQIFNFESGKSLSSMPFPEPIGALTASARRAIIACESGVLVGFEPGQIEMIYDIPKPHSPSAIGIDPTERTIVVGSKQGWLFVSRSKSGRVWETRDLGGEIVAIGVAERGDQFAVACQSQVYVHSTNDLKRPFQVMDISGAQALAFSPDGYLLAVLKDRVLALRHVLTGQLIAEHPLMTSNIKDIAFAKDGRLVGLCVEGAQLTLVDLQRSMSEVSATHKC